METQILESQVSFFCQCVPGGQLDSGEMENGNPLTSLEDKVEKITNKTNQKNFILLAQYRTAILRKITQIVERVRYLHDARSDATYIFDDILLLVVLTRVLIMWKLAIIYPIQIYWLNDDEGNILRISSVQLCAR